MSQTYYPCSISAHGKHFPDRPNTSQPYSPSPPQSLSPPAHLCSFLTLFPDSAEPNTALGDAEHTALQTVAVSSGSNMLELLYCLLSKPMQGTSPSCFQLPMEQSQAVARYPSPLFTVTFEKYHTKHPEEVGITASLNAVTLPMYHFGKSMSALAQAPFSPKARQRRVQQHLDHPGQLNKEGLDRQCSNSFRRGQESSSRVSFEIGKGDSIWKKGQCLPVLALGCITFEWRLIKMSPQLLRIPQHGPAPGAWPTPEPVQLSEPADNCSAVLLHQFAASALLRTLAV
ncbi:hypothetical protein Anapl_09983 [Anas platyrhynchos]|uniref:Uncharacterized protein n=1 Tax=Anas platyrhynchos TaxID=8839 RepID=R0JG82_ANAPL|nr:hypothetical protein Anapl_09983 [Anas platyrhynchos]